MDLFPADQLIQPVKGHPDLIQFRQDFFLAGKAVEDGADSSQTVTEQENGDLIIEGMAAVFDGLDRQNENFVDGAFQRGIKSFLDGQAALCHHHRHEHVIGRVLDLREEEGKGLHMKARVDFQQPTSPLRHIYDGIRKGSISGLSVGGYFRRALVKGRQMISGVDVVEISTTGVPVHPGTHFSVVAGKALTADITLPEVPAELDGEEIRESDFQGLMWQIEELSASFDRIVSGVGNRKNDTSNSDGI